MEFTLHFCVDGELRVQWGDKVPLVPLSFIQRLEATEDIDFLPEWWDNDIMFEEGLTFSNFLNCIEPWAEFLGKIIRKDLNGYIEECKKPIDVSKTNIDWINIFYDYDISDDVEYDYGDPAKNSLIEMLNGKLAKKLTGLWNIAGKYTISGYKEGENEHYNVTDSPLNKIANCKIFLEKRTRVFFYQSNIAEILDKNKELLNEDGYALKNIKVSPTGYVIRYIEGERKHSLLEVIQGVFKQLYFSPGLRDDANDELVELLKETMESRKEEIKTYVEETEPSEDKPKKMKVVFSQNVFSGLEDEYENRRNHWGTIVLKAKQDKKTVLKIGQVKQAISPEDRLFGLIVEKKDYSTEFKKPEE